MSDPSQKLSSGARVESGQDTTIGGDVVGRDKVVSSSTSTSTTYVNEGGPVARYAVIGVVTIAVLALSLLALLLLRDGGPVTPIATPSPPLPSVTLIALAPSATATLVPSATTTATESPIAPSATATPTATEPPPTATEIPPPTATPTVPPGATPIPLPALPVYDDFNDNCLDPQRWTLQYRLLDSESPTPAPRLSADGCLDASRQFFTEEGNRHLLVFVSVEGLQDYGLAQTPAVCFSETAIRLSVNQIDAQAEARSAYLNVGMSLARVSGEAQLELRVGADNYNGRLRHTLRLRLIVPAGSSDYELLGYTFVPGQPITLGFRAENVGAIQGTGTTNVSRRLRVLVNGQPFIYQRNSDSDPQPLSFSILDYPCNLSLGYHSDDQTVLDGLFDEVQLVPIQP